MTITYEEFLVFDLENDGERTKLDIKQEDLQNYLNPEQVLVIIREDIRRIYIWKGAKSPVRKRFISSRVARELQKELLEDPRYHRCKIVSIDQGDELQEFLEAFQLESMEVTERLPDMRYIRNIERERMKEAKQITKGKTEGVYYSPALQDISSDVVMSSIIQKPKLIAGFSDAEQKQIKKKILENEVPNNYKRQNLILGHTLFAAVTKISKVFGEDVEEIVWEPVKKVPKEMMDLDDHKLRVYLNKNKGMVEAVEVLKKEEKPKQSATPEKTTTKPTPNKSSTTGKKTSLTPMPPKPASMKQDSKEIETQEKQEQ
ncbi:MAG: hypothetical protein ACFE8L_01760 [Candidatus Hodarchaeota archaeon]